MGRFLISGDRVVSIRSSSVTQRHDHTYGSGIERDRSGTLFGETSITGAAGRNTWVGGIVLQRDTFRSLDVPRFDYTHTIPGVFAQDDYAAARWLTASASARVDVHSEFGTFFSPRLSLLFRPSSQRQTKYEPLLRPARLRDGRWSTDAWAPLEGRSLNAGMRFRF